MRETREGTPRFREPSRLRVQDRGRSQAMVVGVLVLELGIPHNDSLKGKRSVVKKVIERVRARFNVSMAEVDKQEIYTRAVLGGAVVGSDTRYVNGALDKILDAVAGMHVADLISEEIEILHF